MTLFSCVLPKDVHTVNELKCKCAEKPMLFTADKTQPAIVVISEYGAGALIQNGETGTC